MASSHRCIFFGTTNELSRAAFEELLAGNANIPAVIVTASAAGTRGDILLAEVKPSVSASELPLVSRFHKPTVIQAAWSASIPVYAIGNTGMRPLLDLVANLEPDVACVACYPKRIQPELLELPRHGFLNVHPSRLPLYRGPAPLFWQFQRDDCEARGVTVHQMDAGLDTGPIVVQRPITFADGLGQAMIERLCGAAGGSLLLKAIETLASGRNSKPQAGPGSYHRWPVAGDFELDANWSARRVFNFVRATDGYSMSYPYHRPFGSTVLVLAALDYDSEGNLEEDAMIDGAFARLQFNPGILTARISLLS